MLDTYQDIATHDKIIFPLAFTCILRHIHVPIPYSPLFPMMGAIGKESLVRSSTQLMAKAKRPHQESTPIQREKVEFRAVEDATYTCQPSSSSTPPSSSGVEASLSTILNQDRKSVV